MTTLLCSAAAMLTGFLLDRLIGDPPNFPHIVRLIGGLVSALEKGLRAAFPKTERAERFAGALLAVLVILVSTGAAILLLALGYRCSPILGYVLESLLCWQLLAAKSLKTESMKVARSLEEGDVEGARYALSMIVGRDTASLDESGIVRAAVETVAENASDGVAAPLFYIMLGGAPLGLAYKAVNTMDSMLGYKNEKYLNFGRAAARTDDFWSFLPARLCALAMIVAAWLLGLDYRAALRIWRRDKRAHASPNSAQTESVCAGALGLRLAGPAVYHGKLCDKPYIGDDRRPIGIGDIAAANRLMYLSSALLLILALIFRGVAFLAAV